jgi:UDP-N-acetylglucosamine diphosphorylase/glucosamine-1-phosphate N-acetyltransferase
MRICVFEDGGVVNLDPLTATRPAFDLRCGATTLLEKHRRALGATEVAALVRPALAELCRLDHPGVNVNDAAWAGGGGELVALVNARWLPVGGRLELSGRPEVGVTDAGVAFVVLPAGEVRDLSPDSAGAQLTYWRQQYARRGAGGRLVGYPWELVECNAAALADDFVQLTAGHPGGRRAGLAVNGPAEAVWVDPSAHVEPFVLLDTTKGPVMIDRGAVVQAQSRLEGPCYVGPHTQVLGARVRGSSFGPQCRIGGEVEASVVAGYSNKAHDGFLGHSYLGEWINLAAGTITSDLRIDYAAVRFVVHGQAVDSGLLKVGSFVGDHAKTSLGALFNTGSLVGPFAMLLTAGALLPRQVPAFGQVAHGRLQGPADLAALFTTAATVMARRGREWTPAHAGFFWRLYEATAGTRAALVRENEQRRLRRVV